MVRVSVKRRIKASAFEVWKHIGDFSNIAKFHPLLKGSHFNSDNESCEVGSSRQCDMKDGNYIKERIVDWREGSHYAVEIYETSINIHFIPAFLTIYTRCAGQLLPAGGQYEHRCDVG